MVITFGFAGGFTGGYFAIAGDPFWTVSGGLAGVIGVSAGADVYAPTLAYLIAMVTAPSSVYVGNFIEVRCALTTWSARSRARLCGLPGAVLGRRLRGRLPDRRQQRGQLDRRSADRHRDLPAARLPVRLGRVLHHEEAEHLRVPPEVELRASTLPSTSRTSTCPRSPGARWSWSPTGRRCHRRLSSRNARDEVVI